jgi:hypothetical protein
MLDWLKRPAREEFALPLAGRRLPVAIRRLAHARRMTLRLAPDGSEVRISMPRWGRTADALAFAESRRDWLERQLEALPPSDGIAPGMVLPFRGTPLVLMHIHTAPRRPLADSATLRVGGPEEGLAPRLRRWLEREARALIEADLAEYCARAGVAQPRLALSNARRRWGSCAANGTIRINWRLVMAPDHVRRSVVAHEVAHLLHFDHGTQFHAALEELFEDDVRKANRWLKREGRALYMHFG